MKTKWFCLLVLAIAAPLFLKSAYADDIIKIRLSYKIILDPADGNPPPTLTGPDYPEIHAIVDSMNKLQEVYGRGYRFVLEGPVESIGGMGDTDGPSGVFYNIDLRTHEFDISRPDGSVMRLSAKSVLESTAKDNPILYKWKDKAINIYINRYTSGGKCSFPSHSIFDRSEHVIVIGANESVATHLHEIGHYFSLKHTHQEGFWGIGDENIKDTIDDDATWTSRDRIALENYGRRFNQLSIARQERVLNVWENIMSYHHQHGSVLTRLTEGQLDHWASIANIRREYVTDGQMIFVKKGGLTVKDYATNPTHNWKPLLELEMHHGNAYGEVKYGIVRANEAGGDIILIFPGAYPEKLIINRPVVLRATRQGSVTIGSD